MESKSEAKDQFFTENISFKEAEYSESKDSWIPSIYSSQPSSPRRDESKLSLHNDINDLSYITNELSITNKLPSIVDYGISQINISTTDIVAGFSINHMSMSDAQSGRFMCLNITSNMNIS